jgi:PAS domain S-box-containing protein
MLRSVAPAAAFASLYFLAAALTTSLIGDPGIAVLWPASGVYLGVMLVAPRHLWPSLACAAGVGSLAAYMHAGGSLEVSVAFAVPSSAEGLLAAVLVERIAGGRFALEGRRDLVALVVGGAVIANALVALSAGAVAAQTFGASFGESWLRWWSADALGMITVAPVIVWARGRWGLRIAALGGLGASLAATLVASRGADLVGEAAGADGQVYIVQAFLAVMVLGSLAVIAAAHEGGRARAADTRSRRRLRQVVDSSRDAYLAVDARDRISGWSAPAEAMFGYPAGEALGRSLTEAIGPGAGPATPTPEGSELALMARHREGRQFPVALTVRPGSEGDVDRCHIFIRDLSEGERMREELGRANAELERRRLARDGVRHELERTTRELELAGRRVDELTRELTARSAELTGAGQAQERLAGELRDAQAAARMAEEKLAGELRDAQAAARMAEEKLAGDLRDARAAARMAEEKLVGDLRDAQAAARMAEEKLAGDLRDVQAAARMAEQKLAGARASGRRTEQELAEARRALDEAKHEYQRLGRELSLATADRDTVLAELEDSAREAARLEAALADAGREHSRMDSALRGAAEELAAANASNRALEEQLEGARAEQLRAQEELEETWEQRARAVEELEGARAEQLRALEELDDARGQKARALEELDGLRAEQARAAAELAAARAERVRALDDAEGIHEELAGADAERARLERSLEEAAQRMAALEGERRLLAEHSTEMISRYDERGICLYASPAAGRLLGYDAEELVGRAGAELLHPEDRHRLARARATRAASTFEARLRRKSGDYLSVEVSLRPVWGHAADRMLGVTTIIREIARPQDLRERIHSHSEARLVAPGHNSPNQSAA